MANTISSNASTATAISTLLRTQSTAVSGMKVSAKASQAIIDQLQTNIAQNTAPTSQTSGGGTLPRGSLIDISV